MNVLFIQLQAAMGLGILLAAFAIFCITVILPGIWVATTLFTFKKGKKNGEILDWKFYLYAIMKGFVYGFLTLLGISGLVFIWLYFFVDLTYS
jgi:hypothetical protein